MNIINKAFSEHHKVIESGLNTHANTIEAIGKKLADTLRAGHIIYWCGNGGSAADSQHLAAELIGRFRNTRRPLPSVALTTDSSVLTCIANDFSYDDVFARQIEGLAKNGDVLIGISTSGNSLSVVNALRAAKDKGVTTVALLGKNGGIAKEVADYFLVVDSDSTARIQEFHILVGHILCELIENELGCA